MARDDGYLSARESRRISKENRKITAKLEKVRTRRNVPESEYMTQMKNPANAVEFENLHTFFFTDAGTVKSVDSVRFRSAAWQDGWRRGRVGLRQVCDQPFAHAAVAAPAGPGGGRLHPPEYRGQGL